MYEDEIGDLKISVFNVPRGPITIMAEQVQMTYLTDSHFTFRPLQIDNISKADNMTQLPE